ncbi:ribonucleases P/MRP protein subunit POP1 [Pelobates fuscus]|uniref:ribonucleases P/MRP protein subunit POP1 n=1 Tax=Pelobates fuscus TaxID=191477 RepID=UPI002FE4CE47
MSTAKEKKYAKRMRNQPSSVSLTSDVTPDRGSRPAEHGSRGNVHSHRDSHPGSSGQHQRYSNQSPFQSRGGRGRSGPADAHLVPKYITATMFAQARAAEINAMVKAVSQKTSNCLVFQSLPRHMRRRAMGHDIKRLPRRLREIAKKEMEKTVHQKKELSKNKCRKARRRHGNLVMEFNRRQRKNIWLETHIWHSKRFHMVKKWGYCLPDRPTMKNYRGCYRAMTNHCLLQDLSYLCCLELIGEENDILKSMSRLCSTDTGPSFAAAQCLSGRRQGSLTMYKADKYPEEALGPVTFIWKPKGAQCVPSGQRQLWIWMHPAMKQDVLKELRHVFSCEETPDNAVPAAVLQQEEQQVVPKSTSRKRKRRDKEGEKVVPVKKIIGDGTRDSVEPYKWTSKESSIVISDLTMEIVRYRLVGPLSHSVLTEVLRAAPLHTGVEVPEGGPHNWWLDFCRDENNVNLHSHQESVFQLLQALDSPAQVPPGTILGLTVGDPRLNLPKQKTKAVPNLEKYKDVEQVKSLRMDGFPVECTQSLIWSSSVRSKVTDGKISDQEINRLRSELLVPGSQLSLGDNESKIPVLLIQQPGKVTGTERPGWASGWDICLPKGWGMAFWIPLVYRGFRVGGLQQDLQRSQFMGSPYVPGDVPDCLAGIQSAKETETCLLDKYKGRPPAKRTNFIKHGILAPFRCPWEQLTREWEIRARTDKESIGRTEENTDREETKAMASEAAEPIEEHGVQTCPSSAENEPILKTEEKCGDGFLVLRDKKLLYKLSAFCSPFLRGRRGCQSTKATTPELSSMINPILKNFPRSLVWVRLSMLTKGSPELHALISIPSDQDLLQMSKDKSFPGPQEPKHSDSFKNKVVKLKKERMKEKAQKKACSSNDKEDPEKIITSEQALQNDDLTLGLWPDPLPELTTHCNRVLIGFVTQGNFSLTVGCGEALGFVSLTGLAHLLSCQPADRRGLVLIRNPSSLHHRFAKLLIDM